MLFYLTTGHMGSIAYRNIEDTLLSELELLDKVSTRRTLELGHLLSFGPGYWEIQGLSSAFC